MASTLGAMPTDHDARAIAKSRSELRERVIAATRRSTRADELADEARAAMYDTWIEAHGRPADGKLSYGEIAVASGRSRQRVIQIIQPGRVNGDES